MAVFTHKWCSPLPHTRPAAVPIKIYKMVHTGPKTQFGGLKLGLFNVKYQSLTELCVAKLDKNPINRQTKMAVITFSSLFFMVGAVRTKIAIYFIDGPRSICHCYLCRKMSLA